MSLRPWWDDLYVLFGIFSLAVGLMVYLWLILAAYFYRKKPGDKPARDALKAGVFPHERGNKLVEAGWTFGAFFVVFILTIVSVPALEYVSAPPKDCTDPEVVCVNVIGHQWFWEFDVQYPAGSKVLYDAGSQFTVPDGGVIAYSNGSTRTFAPGESVKFNDATSVAFPNGLRAISNTNLDLPCGRTIILVIDSADVIHAFWIPDYGIKADAIRNRQQLLWFEANDPGTYRSPCAEYCGDMHTFMIGSVKVSPADGCPGSSACC
ncbi:MAG TPA: cytochrome c oxidase subunit II [Thermoplasmata archaeon]|nr:cytochrome c oxidase subunit II [Thermoplasmata archaeon]